LSCFQRSLSRHSCSSKVLLPRLQKTRLPLPLQSADVGDIALDLDSHRAAKGLGENESDKGSRDNHEQEDREDNGFADADDTPIIQEVELGFLLGLSFDRIHKVNKKGASVLCPAPLLNQSCVLIGSGQPKEHTITIIGSADFGLNLVVIVPGSRTEVRGELVFKVQAEQIKLLG